MKSFVFALVLALAACGPVIKVPLGLEGQIALRVLNDTQYSICEFRLAIPSNPPRGLGESWIKSGRAIMAGDTHDLKVHPGNYQIFVESCDKGFEAWLKRVPIEGPTEISLGGHRGSSPGVRRIALQWKEKPHYAPRGGAGPAAEPAGEEQPASEGEAPAESSSGSTAPAPRDCLPSGTKTDNYHKCCSEAAKTQIEASDNIFTCA